MSNLYHSLVKKFLFSLDAEKAHNLALKAIELGWVSGRVIEHESLKRTLFGVEFPNPIGLAAGFDKNGVAMDEWKNFGFGFVEVGTVTMHPQPGNPKPRMFRLPNEIGLINRLGFNNLGSEALARRLEVADPGIPVGINIGKSKITPLEEAHLDYAFSYKLLHSYGDYFVVNVSSPNTEGLRSLQEKDFLARIFEGLKKIDSSQPLFVKIAPELDETGLESVVRTAIDFELTGIIATNTTLDRSMLDSDPDIQGGLSGKPLLNKANKSLKTLKEISGDQLILIGVGGVTNGESAKEKLDLGASLVQIYSGWVYGGPGLPSDICNYLVQNP